MTYLLTILLAIAPANATSTSVLDSLSPADVCELVNLELQDAADVGIISRDTAWDIYRRCYTHYAN